MYLVPLVVLFVFGSKKPLCDAFLFSWVLFSFLNSGFSFSPSKSSISLNGLSVLPFCFESQLLLDCLEAKETGYTHTKLGLTLFSGFKVSPEPTAFWLSSAHSATGLTPYMHSAFSVPSRRTVVLEKTLESPLDCKKIQPVNPKRNQPWIFIGRSDAEAETPILWPPNAKTWLIGKDPDAGKDWGQEEKGMTEDEIVGQHH